MRGLPYGRDHHPEAYDLVGRLLPASDAVVVEVGSRTGIWTCRILDRYRDRVRAVFCVDPFARPAADFKWWTATLRGYAFVKAFPLVGLSLWWARFFPLPIDVLFVDADHMGDAPLLDARAWTPKVRVGGAAIFHDHHMRPVRDAVEATFHGRCSVGALGPTRKGVAAVSAWAIKVSDDEWRAE